MTDFLVAPIDKIYHIGKRMHYLPKTLVDDLVKNKTAIPVIVGDNKVGYATLSYLTNNVMATVTLTDVKFTKETQAKLHGTFIRTHSPEGDVLTHYSIESLNFPREATEIQKPW